MSLTVAALRELVDCGLTAEQILRVAEAQGNAPVQPRSTGAERQARYRGRLKGTGMTREQWRDTSARVLARDAHKCRYCEAPAVCTDHVEPLIAGGSSADDNLVAACIECNSGKSGRTLEDWKGTEWATAWRKQNASPLRVTVTQKVSPTPPSKNTPLSAPKGASIPPLETDLLADELWQAANPTSKQRSGRPATRRAVAAAVRKGASAEALLASVRDHCRVAGDHAKGLHRIVEAELWREVTPRMDQPPDIDPSYRQHLEDRFHRTGEWNDAYGPRPERRAA